MSDDRSAGWGYLAVLFALVTLVVVCINARSGWRAETLPEIGAAFAATGGPLLALGALLTGLPAMRAHRRGGWDARRGALAGMILVLAVTVHASLVVAALTYSEPYDPDRRSEVLVTK